MYNIVYFIYIYIYIYIIYLIIFWEDEKLGSLVGDRGWEFGFTIICFKIGLFNFSPCLCSPFFLIFLNNWNVSFICYLSWENLLLPINFGFLMLNQDKGVDVIFFNFSILFFASLLFNRGFLSIFVIVMLICFVFNHFCKCMC